MFFCDRLFTNIQKQKTKQIRVRNLKRLVWGNYGLEGTLPYLSFPLSFDALSTAFAEGEDESIDRFLRNDVPTLTYEANQLWS